MSPAPPLLIAAALALWGWTSGSHAVAAALAVVLEGSRYLPLGIAVEPGRFRSIAVLTRVAIFGVLAWQAAQKNLPAAILGTLQWAPVLFAPILVAQRYSRAGTIPGDVLQMRGTAPGAVERVDLTQMYVATCLLSAAGCTHGRPLFFPLLVAIVAFAGAARAWRGRRFAAIAMFAIAVALGQLVHVGLFSLQHKLEDGAIGLIGEWLAGRSDPDRSRTRIGELGRVKLSDRIVMRVAPGPSMQPPFLLRDGGYTSYSSGVWGNELAVGLTRVLPEGDPSRFTLGGPPTRGATGSPPDLTIRMRPGTAIAPLAVPPGAVRIERLAANALAVNGRGAVLAEAPAPFVEFDVWRGPAADGSPGAEDLAVPETLERVLDASIAEIEAEAPGALARRSTASVEAVAGFFASRFRYSLFLGDASSGVRSIADFLARDRAGHCEYFATATVMLLRRAGIPARYQTGFAVEEWSELESAYVVRARHGHAWATAFVDGAWRTVDTTPPDWSAIERGVTRSLLQPLVDLASWLRERFDRWRADGSPVAPGLVAGAIALFVAILASRGRRLWPGLVAGLRSGRPGRAPKIPSAALAPIETYFAARGLGRAPSRPWFDWIEDLRARGFLDEASHRSLSGLVREHYRGFYGRGPATDSAQAARDWVERMPNRTNSR